MGRGSVFEEAELRVWLIGGGEPLVFRMTNEHAQQSYDVISARWADEPPSGTMGFKDGTMIRVAAIAAVRMTLSDRPPSPVGDGGWVANPPTESG